MNSRSTFNHYVQTSKLSSKAYPVAVFDGKVWVATSHYDNRKFYSKSSKKTTAVDLVLEDIFVVMRKKYCCDLLCFVRPLDEVDGIACRECASYSYCRCLCASFKPQLTLYEMLWARKGEYTIRFSQLGLVCEISVLLPEFEGVPMGKSFLPASAYENELRLKDLIRDALRAASAHENELRLKDLIIDALGV